MVTCEHTTRYLIDNREGRKTDKDMSDERKSTIDDMDFTTLRNIKCDNLFNRLSQWLAGLYDPDSREVVVPGRGRLSVNEESVHHIMGVPRGDIVVDL